MSNSRVPKRKLDTEKDYQEDYKHTEEGARPLRRGYVVLVFPSFSPSNRKYGLSVKETTSCVVYYESIKRELKTEPIYECRYDERLKSRYMSVGVMKDYKIKLRNLRASHTLGWSWNWNT